MSGSDTETHFLYTGISIQQKTLLCQLSGPSLLAPIHKHTHTSIILSCSSKQTSCQRFLRPYCQRGLASGGLLDSGVGGTSQHERSVNTAMHMTAPWDNVQARAFVLLFLP
ncbi:hypothetical protein QQF64_015351 [Cirrhinus molitorella]|uniref:Uncharacterized protein n=1 Tax=Cirrhinus molitorella TaxID=172907 RepID=A0ABR3NUP5_9TELE